MGQVNQTSGGKQNSFLSCHLFESGKSHMGQNERLATLEK